MARLCRSLQANFLHPQHAVPCLSHRFSLLHRTQWRFLCALSEGSSSFSFPKQVEDVTIIDTTRGAVRAVQTLLELPLERRVSWSTQLYKPSTAVSVADRRLTASAYAGDDVDFGNGPHLFVSDSATGDNVEIWNLLRRYFQTDECKKVWFHYPNSMSALAIKGVRPTGFGSDVVHMTRLYRDKGKKTDIDAVAKMILTKSNLAKSYSLWEKNKLSTDEVKIRYWNGEGKSDDPRITPQWMVRACYEASLTYRMDERLRKLLAKESVHGDAYNTHGGTSAMHRNEDVFNLLQAYEVFFQPQAEAFHDLEREGLPVDFGLLQQVALEDKHTKKLLEDEFRGWATAISADATHIDISSPTQLRQILFAPCVNIENKKESLPTERSFRITLAKIGDTPTTESAAKEATVDMPKTESTTKSGVKNAAKKERKKKTSEIVLRGAGIKAVSYTKQGWPSTSFSALREALDEYKRNPSGILSDGFPDAMESLLESMEIGRRLKWYTDGANVGSIVDDDGRIRMHYQMDPYTGRLASSSNGKDWEPLMLQCLKPTKGNDLVHVQFPDVEMWTLAHLSGCTSLHGRMSSESNTDKLLAYELFWRSNEEGHPASLSDVTREQCHTASMLDRAVRRGGNVADVESLVECTKEEAERLMATWYDLHPGVRKWRNGREAFINQNGFAETYMGRRKKMRRGRVVEGIGFIVKGTAAEIVTGTILSLRQDERVKVLKWRPVHADRDEIVLEGPSHSAESLLEVVEKVLQKPLGFEMDASPRTIMYHTQGEKEAVEEQSMGYPAKH